MRGGLHVRVTQDFGWDRLRLVAYEDRDGKRAFADDMVLREVPDGEPAPSLAEIGADSAQQLMDDLWRCGVRPTEGAGTAGSMRATERHLDDMRAIAAGMLKPHGVEIK